MPQRCSLCCACSAEKTNSASHPRRTQFNSQIKCLLSFCLIRSRYGLYRRSQSGANKTAVTVQLQEQVVLEFMKEGAAAKYFDSIPSGLSFLRGAVGNFPSHLAQLVQAANYVRLTQKCVRGSLRQAQHVDASAIPLVEPDTGTQLTLADLVPKDRPLVIMSSSYS